MRIIAGYLKGRKILDPIDKSTRPLKDMVRESIFNIIEHSKITDCPITKDTNVLDLYSGIGSFGLECISRGVKQVYFFEKYIPTLNILKKNIQTLECEDKCQIFEKDIENIEEVLKIKNIKFNLVFLDPPFLNKNINIIIDKIYDMKILSDNALIIIHRNKNTEEKYSKRLEELKVEKYGKSKIVFAKISNFFI
tara:strand:- start:991 stop:1572 length:582 start_codon:yes stop_codon:yes gene_type:complete